MVGAARPRRRNDDVAFALRPPRRLHLARRQDRALARCQAARPVARPALWRAASSRASAPMAGTIFKSSEHSARLRRSAEILDFTVPYSVAELDAAKQLVLDRNGLKDAYVRPVAWRGSEMMAVAAQRNTIHVAIATWEWPSMFDIETKMKGIRLDIADYRRPDPRTAPVAVQGRRPLHDLHDLQASRRAQGLCRRADVRLAGPRRRMHRRQRLLHEGRQDPHAASPTASSTASRARR